MNFNEVKSRITDFLRNSRSGDPSDVLNAYFAGVPEESRIEEAEELLVLIAERTARPQTTDINSGSPGVIAMKLPYAYPLLLTVLGWWFHAVLNTGTAKELLPEEKAGIHKRLKDGILRWDWKRCDEHHYDRLLDQLVPPETYQSQAKPTKGILGRLKLFFCGFVES